MPCCLLIVAIGVNEHGAIHGWSLALLILGVVLDLGGHGGAARSRKRAPLA